MINDFMAILPLKVWVFWLFILIIIMAILARKGYNQIIADHRALAALIEKKKDN